MVDQQRSCSSAQQESNFTSLNILGEFYLNKHHYLIVYFEESSEALIGSDSKFSLTKFGDSVVGQLTVNQRPCLIIEIEYYPSKDCNSDVKTLLTEREIQIAQLVANGHSNKQIACQLHISEWTVSTHLRRVFAKLGIDSRAAMVYQCSSLLNNLNHLI